VSQRRKLLDYLKVKDADKYRTLIDKLGLRKAAERAVRGLIGVRGIANQVHVKPLVTSGQVEQRIQGALARHAERDAKHVNVRVDGSKVTVSGRVHSLAERDAICGAAWSSPGVALVVDDLVVF